MATFTERHEHKIEIIPPYSILQCRRTDIVEKDGAEVGRTYHRHVCVPGDDVTNECDEMKAVATALWTPEVIAAYQASIASSGPSRPSGPQTQIPTVTPEPTVTEVIPETPEEPVVTPEPTVTEETPTEEPTLVRARNEDGTFIADDPSTPDVDEAWVAPEPVVEEPQVTEEPVVTEESINNP